MAVSHRFELPFSPRALLDTTPPLNPLFGLKGGV